MGREDHRSKPPVRASCRPLPGVHDPRYHRGMRVLVVVSLLSFAACQTTAPQPGDDLWNALTPLCGQAFEGRLAEGTEPSDAAIGAERLVMHVRSCSNDEIRIPFHVGEDRSRTWVLTRTPVGIRLKHDHRHEDGSEDAITQYGGDTRSGDDDRSLDGRSLDGRSLDFHADAHTAALLPASRTNIWTMAVEPGATFSYALRREESGRRFRVVFDLTRPVPAPPPPW